jgi:hypothetical protein
MGADPKRHLDVIDVTLAADLPPLLSEARLGPVWSE